MIAWKTIHGKDKAALAKASLPELLSAWRNFFRQEPPGGCSGKQLRDTLVASTSPLRLDFEIMRQRGLAVEGETSK